MQNAAVSTDHTPVPPQSGPSLRGAARTLEAAQHRIAAAGGIHIGDLVSWNGTGIDVEREEARRAFATVGLEGLVAHIAPAAALTRAVSETRRPAHLRVTAFLAKNSDTPVAYGVYQLKGNGESGDAHLCGARVRVDMKLDTVIATPPEGGVVIDECMVLAEQIAAKANRIVTHAETRDVGASMVAAVKRLSGVGLRDKGGFYLLPPASCSTWRTLKPELEKLGVQPIRIEMHDAPDNVQVAAGAAQSALEEDIKELLVDLDKATGAEGMRKHAIERRVSVCRELKAKAELFRGVLAGTVDEIARRVTALGQAFEAALDQDGAAASKAPQTPAERLGLFAVPPVVDDSDD